MLNLVSVTNGYVDILRQYRRNKGLDISFFIISWQNESWVNFIYIYKYFIGMGNEYTYSLYTYGMETQMKDLIIKELEKIEREENMKILFAIESGSRAWGFPSADSDYDVRFVYIRPSDWYLSIDDQRDVLEYPINDLLDISGWDIRKAFRLFRKSNPSLLEWINSPITYSENFTTRETLKELCNTYFSRKANMHHYLNMARDNYRTYLQGEFVKSKKYFYVLRPLLACQWLDTHNSLPPMEFQTLLNALVNDVELKREIELLLERKIKGDELDLEPRISIINQYVEEQISHFENHIKTIEDRALGDVEQLNKIFRTTLKESCSQGLI